MRIGFISPSFRPLEVNWQHDYEMIKLGVPTVMGYLYRAGHHDLAHWDFDAQVCDAIEQDPTSFDLRAYFNADAVKGFIAGTDDSLRAQTEKLLDTLGVTECDIFGISLAAVLDRIVNVMALASLSQCLAVVLKERYPKCVVTLGGLQASPDSLHPKIYTEVLEQCAHIDYALSGEGTYRAVQLYRNLVSGNIERIRNVSYVLYRDGGVVRIGSGGDFDPDNQPPTGQTTHHPAHTKSVAEARLAAMNAAGGTAVVESLALAPVVPLGRLFRGRNEVEGPVVVADVTPVDPAEQSVPHASADRPHFYDLEEADASKAGAPEYTELPARVPYYDRHLVEQFRYSGAQIMKKFHFDKEKLLKFTKFENDRIVVLPHIFVKGCNAPCGFCSYAYTKIEGEHVEETVAGLKWLSETYQCNAFHFLNTQINSVYAYCEAFCDEIVRQGLDILWSDCCNMRALDERLLEKMRRAGAMRLVFGVESPEDEMLKYIRKGVNTTKIERLIKASHDLGIWNHVLLIAGMPHETKAKQDRMMDFLTRLSPQIDFFSISSFYLIASSPWGSEPEKFGIERMSSPDQLLEEQAFNEVADGRWESDGLKWPEKKQQIIESTQRFYSTISAAKGQSRCVGGNIDLYLLMFLYNALGHDRKAEIAEVYTQTARDIGHVRNVARPTELPEHVVRISVPVVVGRMNEGDQSSLVNLPVDVVVSARGENKPGFIGTNGYTFAYETRNIREAEQFAKNTMAPVKENLPLAMVKLGKLLGPFAQALETRLKPTTPAQMARLLSVNLPRYAPFTKEGFFVAGSKDAEGRTVMERNLEWSGLS